MHKTAPVNAWMPSRRTARVFFAGLFGLGVFLSVAGSHGFAQSTGNPADDIAKPSFSPQRDAYRASEVDPVTLAILSDALLRLQFLAVAALESEEDVGLAQSGVVRAYLARRQMDKAIEIAQRIADPVWSARSFLWISDYVRIVQKDASEARAWMDRAIAEVKDQPPSDKVTDTYGIAANRLAQMGAAEAATATAKLIADRQDRVRTLREIASVILNSSDDEATKQAVATVLRQTFDEASLLPKSQDLSQAYLLMDIGAAQLVAGDTAGAQVSFATAQLDIMNGPSDARMPALIQLAAKMVESGNQRGGMIVVRMVPEGAYRAEALSAVSAALGRRNIDAAVPLFRLAEEEIDRIEDQSARFRAITYLVARETEIGRLKDALETAFKITEDVPRAEALLGMGRVLIDQGKLPEALVLKDYIPYIGMRAQIMAAVALGRGLENDPEGASALLAESLDPTGFPTLPEYVPDALDAVLSAQIKVGLESADQAIFSRARDLSEVLETDLAKVRALVQVAIAEARRGRIEDAQKTISAAYRIAFENKGDQGFNSALLAISLAQLAAGDLLGAYDTAARIPEPQSGVVLPRTPDGGFDVPRYQALIRVAAAAGRLGDPNFGQEVTDKIGVDPAKAVGLAAVAIAMSNQSADLIDVINDIRDGALLSPNYESLAQEQPAAAAPTGAQIPESAPAVSQEQPMEQAPTLAPLPEAGN